MPSLKNQCKFCCGRVICCRIKQPHLHALINGAEFTAKIHQDPACQIYSEGEEEKISCIDDIDELDKNSSCCKRQKEPKHEKREKKKKKETKEAESQPKESKQKPKDKSPSESSKFPYKPSEEAEIKFPIVECKSSKKSRGKSPCRRKKKEKKSKSPSKKSKSKSPSKKSKSKSPSKKSKSKSPSRKSKSKSPSSKKRKKKSKSPRKKKSKSPSEKKSKSPSEEKCISPSEKKSKPPREKKSKPPREKKSKSPCEKKSKSPSKEKSKSPRKEKSRTREKAKSPSKTRSKSKHKSKSIFQRCRSKCSKSRKTDEVCESIHTAEGDSTMIKPYEGKIIQDVRGRWCCLLIDDLKKLIKESQKDKSNISCPTQNEYDAESEHLKNELKKLLQRNMQDAVLSHETLSSKCKFKTSEENPEKDRWSLYFEDDISTINSKRQKGHIRKRCYSFRESKILDLFCPNRRKNLANKNACEQSKGNEKRKHKKKRKDRTTEIARDVIEEIFEDVLQNMCGQAMYKKSEDTYKDTCLDYSKNSSYTSAITSPKTEIKKPVEERRSVDIYCPESDKVSKKSLSKQSEHSCSDYSEDSLTSKTTTTTKDHPKNVRKQEKRMMAEERIIIRPMQKKMKTENSICEPKIIKKKIEKIKENDKKGATVTIRKLDYKECKYSEETFRDSNCDYTEISSVNTSVTKDNEVVSEKSMTTTKRISGPFPSSYREKKMKAKKPVGKPKAIFKKKEKIKGEKKKVKEKKKRKDKESAKTKKPEKKTSKRTIFKRGLSDKRKVHFNDLNEHKMPETNEIIDVLTCSVNVNEETPNEKLTKESEKEGEEFRNLRNSEDHSNAQTKPEICEKPKRRKIYNVFCASRRKNLRKTKKSNTNKRKEKIKRKDKITKKQRVTKTATKRYSIL
ncbi:hypothetical protein O3M35_013036 [Rhynocoris fuscipes]|uniref:Uncharacterized protein n=1 Tax=Rhynocoris fuscipes TaxID=488301 RepID=A0AAW1CED3_9HEMI